MHATYLLRWSVLAGLSLLLLVQPFGSHSSRPAQAQSSAGIGYIYDELGRLTAVVDPTNGTARYTYDAAGNLLSIARQSSTAVSVIQVTPGSAPVGATVTISGTAFSTTPSQDTVSFNGVTATVTSATTTQLVTTVPSSATTGTLSVTTPAGSATSTNPFTVAASTVPTISSFSPTIAAAHATISATVNGSNFETTPTSNNLRFGNSVYGQITSATAGTLAATIPGVVSSGSVTVATPAGSANGGDFFVAPAPYTATDVQYTGRMTVGDTKTLSVTTANKVGLMIFDGC